MFYIYVDLLIKTNVWYWFVNPLRKLCILIMFEYFNSHFVLHEINEMEPSSKFCKNQQYINNTA